LPHSSIRKPLPRDPVRPDRQTSLRSIPPLRLRQRHNDGSPSRPIARPLHTTRAAFLVGYAAASILVDWGFLGGGG
jgi:hypothetical protein